MTSGDVSTSKLLPDNSPLSQERPDKLRADARLNRTRILDAARGMLVTDPQVSLNQIGKAAGVGQGTLYRHFPSREALVLAVYRHEIEILVALAPTLLAAHPPLAAFRRWCDRLAEIGRVKHGVADVLHAVISDQDFQATYGPLVAAVGELIDACQASGDMRPEARPEDFLLLTRFLWQTAPGPDGDAQAHRLLELVFRGLAGAD